MHTAFAHAGSNQVRAARLLGITRNMMRTQLKRHGLLQGDDLQTETAEASASSASIA